MPEFRKLKLRKNENERALYAALELKDHGIPFKIEQVYFAQDFKQPVGGHCHKIQHEIFMMIKGSCAAEIDAGKGLEEFLFTAPNEALYVSPYVWHRFKDCSPDAILLALSSTNYNPDRSDYIEDYEQYKALFQNF